MLIETERLILKTYTPEDIQGYYMLQSNEAVWKYSTNKPIQSMDTVREKLEEMLVRKNEDDIGFCALFEKESNTYIGEAGILSLNKSAERCVIGYNLLPTFWNKGYATEITTALVKYAFYDLHVERVEALAMELNTASCKVLQKAGMQKEGILRHFAKIEDTFYDVAYFGLIKEDSMKRTT